MIGCDTMMSLMNNFGVAPESKVYYHLSDDEIRCERLNRLNFPITVYGDGMTGDIRIHKRINDGLLYLINWENEYGELGGLRCTGDTVIYIIRDDKIIGCPVKDILVGDILPVRYKHETSISAKIIANSIVPYIDPEVYFLENITGMDTIIINDIIIKMEGIYEDNSRMVAD